MSSHVWVDIYVHTCILHKSVLACSYIHVFMPLIQHDEPGTTCAPGGSAGNYIMYPSATDGSRQNNNHFSECSVTDMGRTIESNGKCFLPRELYNTAETFGQAGF